MSTNDVGTFELALTNFTFPPDLSNSKANFRFIVDVRFVDSEGQFVTQHAVMPSMDTYWECDKGKRDNPNYVRNGEVGAFAMRRIDAWDRLILRLKAQEVHSIQFKVIDVNRDDAWDKIKGVLRGLGGALRWPFGEKEVTLTLPVFGSASSDLESFTLKRLAGGHKVLFRGATLLTENEAGKVGGSGTEGQYGISFTCVRLQDPTPPPVASRVRA